MKRLVALFLSCCLLLVGCGTNKSLYAVNEEVVSNSVSDKAQIIDEPSIAFDSLEAPELLSYYENAVYSELIDLLDNNKYLVDNIELKYISKEYLEEINYNSQENIYFGYKLSDIEDQFEGTKYVFSVDENNHTIVKSFEKYDDTFDQVLKDVAIGTGVILVCVTVSAVTGGAAPAISVIFAESAKRGTSFALSSGLISGTIAGITTGFKTGDFDETLKSAALAASDEFKWGAISGAIIGGAGKAFALKGATLNGLTMNNAATIQKESKYPLDVIKQFKNMDQYNICKKAGLRPNMVNGKVALTRNIKLDTVDEFGRTNLVRMEAGLAPLDSTGIPYELHHIGQKTDSTLAILTKAEHMKNGNNKIWHVLGEETKVHGPGNTWQSQKELFWKTYSKMVGGN